MNFVVYCHIFLCICIIYNVIFMNLDVFGDFPKDPPYFGYNFVDRKTLFCVFSRFRDLYGLKLTGDFSRIIIFRNMTKLSFGITQTESRRRKEQGWRAPPPGRATTSLLPFGASQPSSKSSRRFPWPKNPIYKGARHVSWKRRCVDQKHQNPARNSHHRRGTLLRSRDESDLLPLQDQDQDHHHHDEKGVVHLWTMGL